jgi:hypothetical protein
VERQGVSFKKSTGGFIMAFCSNCGKKLDEGVKFCTSCGARVEENILDQQININMVPPQQQTAYNAASVSSGQKKSAWDYFCDAVEKKICRVPRPYTTRRVLVLLSFLFHFLFTLHNN